MVIQRQYGGHGSVAFNLKKYFQRKGHKVKIISREDDFHIYSFIRGFFSRKFRALNKEKYDIIYTSDWSIGLTFLFKKNHFCCFHGYNPKGFGRIIQLFLGRLMKNRVVVVGDLLKEKFPKANFIYNGVDLEKFIPLNEERKYFGWVKKGSEIKTKEQIKELADLYNLPLLILENTPYEEMNDFYNKLKVFASYPPSFAGFNMVWLEAMASGVPIILGNQNGIGSKLPINNNKETDFRKYLIENNFSWEKKADELLGIFEKCMKKD